MEIGALHVRRSSFINATPTRVWEEFTTFDKISAWLNLGHTLHQFEPIVGGQVRMSVTIDGDDRHYGGQVVAYDKASELSFESQWDEPHDWPVPTFWTIRLSAFNDGTLLELFHHGFERLSEAAADDLEGYESGWDNKHLIALRRIVEG